MKQYIIAALVFILWIGSQYLSKYTCIPDSWCYSEHNETAHTGVQTMKSDNRVYAVTYLYDLSDNVFKTRKVSASTGSEAIQKVKEDTGASIAWVRGQQA